VGHKRACVHGVILRLGRKSLPAWGLKTESAGHFEEEGGGSPAVVENQPGAEDAPVPLLHRHGVARGQAEVFRTVLHGSM